MPHFEAFLYEFSTSISGIKLIYVWLTISFFWVLGYLTSFLFYIFHSIFYVFNKLPHIDALITLEGFFCGIYIYRDMCNIVAVEFNLIDKFFTLLFVLS